MKGLKSVKSMKRMSGVQLPAGVLWGCARAGFKGKVGSEKDLAKQGFSPRRKDAKKGKEGNLTGKEIDMGAGRSKDWGFSLQSESGVNLEVRRLCHVETE
ncbi:MAG: hypothetical protein V2A74_14135 [bacterium]